jgi:hypothetical protein
MDAIKMSCCMPMLFQPIVRDGCCYIDGGIMVNYPLRECLEDTRCRSDEVLGLRNRWNNSNEGIGDQSSLLEYMRFINLQLVRLVNANAAAAASTAAFDGVSEVTCHVKPDITPAEWFSIMSDSGQRLAWINDGIAFAKEFLAAKISPSSKDTEERTPTPNH